ncbi:MAG: hypothetical protein A2928_01605 [Candidatus Taylorbacteria bacterium RIFCSPLOWO2_01_FULL_45_15b]|uniref:Peptidoglycan binding-like domain-containing protein n=1 Tax=Candidatus Taylorbacteria bacterium RIFCSPLOWO2_01_FULL_45_15b TaxID=1802319 RepID=A0A1G2NB31_9BACT|nr:MAG: hypothetical protein A2928_01605 [Candidatus Taylorbacteria bacterium RIFCSPLOWO2_01_FULL_45_15b]
MKKIFLSILCTALLVSGTGIASAQSISLSQLVELFISLGIIAPDKAVQARVAVQNAENNIPSAACYRFNGNLKVGDKNPDVLELHRALGRHADAPSSLTLTDEYTEITASYVVVFQEKYASEVLTQNGLRRGTGYVGPSTRAKLNALCGRTSVERPIVTDVINVAPPILPPTTLDTSSVSTQPSVSISSPNSGSFVAGSTITVNWNKAGQMPGDSRYYVYLKAKPDQLLNGTTPNIYYTLVDRSATLNSPSFTVTLPTDDASKSRTVITPGAYYIEVAWASTNGTPVVTATSGQIVITPSEKVSIFDTLGVNQNSQSLAVSVIGNRQKISLPQGTSNVAFIELMLDASQSGQDVTVSSATLFYYQGKPNNGKLSNCSIASQDGNIVSRYSEVLQTGMRLFTFSTPVVVRSGATHVIALSCDVPNDALGPYSWLAGNQAITSARSQYGTVFDPVVTPLPGRIVEAILR